MFTCGGVLQAAALRAQSLRAFSDAPSRWELATALAVPASDGCRFRYAVLDVVPQGPKDIIRRSALRAPLLVLMPAHKLQMVEGERTAF